MNNAKETCTCSHRCTCHCKNCLGDIQNESYERRYREYVANKDTEGWCFGKTGYGGKLFPDDKVFHIIYKQKGYSQRSLCGQYNINNVWPMISDPYDNKLRVCLICNKLWENGKNKQLTKMLG